MPQSYLNEHMHSLQFPNTRVTAQLHSPHNPNKITRAFPSSKKMSSAALSLTTTHVPVFFQCQDTSKENPKQKLASDTSIIPNPSRRKLLKSFSSGLAAAAGLSSVQIQPVRAEPESPQESTSNRMSYSRFLEYLDEGAVRKVDLFQNGTVAIAEISNPVMNRIQRVRVQLPGLQQELLRKLKDKDVDFAAHPMEPNYGLAVLDFLSNFGFPLLLLGSLFLRNSSSPGGPTLPFGRQRVLRRDVFTCLRKTVRLI